MTSQPNAVFVLWDNIGLGWLDRIAGPFRALSRRSMRSL
jgi:hypothetical protein